MFNNHSTAPALSFLPSLLTPDRHSWRVTIETEVSQAIKGQRVWGMEDHSHKHTVTYLHL